VLNPNSFTKEHNINNQKIIKDLDNALLAAKNQTYIIEQRMLELKLDDSKKLEEFRMNDNKQSEELLKKENKIKSLIVKNDNLEQKLKRLAKLLLYKNAMIQQYKNKDMESNFNVNYRIPNENYFVNIPIPGSATLKGNLSKKSKIEKQDKTVKHEKHEKLVFTQKKENLRPADMKKPLLKPIQPIIRSIYIYYNVF